MSWLQDSNLRPTRGGDLIVTQASKEVVQTIVDPAAKKVGSTSWNDFALPDQEKHIGRVKRNLPDV
jgi:hypothetical protein